VVDTYLRRGLEVVIVDDLSTGRACNLDLAAKFYQIDIRSPRLYEVFEEERPDYVNYHPAQMNVRRSVAEPLFDAEANVLGSLNLIECAKLYQADHFVYILTGGAVYGEPEFLPCDEAHPIRPNCQHGVSKHSAEHYLVLYHVNYGLRYTVLRYPNVYGPRQGPHGEAGVVAIFTEQMLTGQQIVINGDGEQVLYFVYVGDCAEANYLALTVAPGHGIYNLGSGQGHSVNDIFSALHTVTGYADPPVHGPAKVGETRRIFLDVAKVQRELGWTPTVSLAHGLEQTRDDFRVAEHAA
jgi:UDP-glucose 4-epimerase